jgi:hypothetical protein
MESATTRAQMAQAFMAGIEVCRASRRRMGQTHCECAMQGTNLVQSQANMRMDYTPGRY